MVCYHSTRTLGKKCNLGNGLLLASNKAKERAKHTEEGEESTSKGNTRFGVGLESSDRVDTRERDKFESLVSKELDGVLGEGKFI